MSRMTEPHIQRIYGARDLPCSIMPTVRGLLEPGETLVWAGRPAPAILDGKLAFALVFGAFAAVFGGIMLGFSVIRILDYDTAARLQGWIFVVQGLLFILMGITFGMGAIGPALAASRTVYAITDKRALIASGFLRRRLTSFAPEDIEELLRLDRDEGYGHLIFAKRRKNLLLQDKDRSRYVGIGFFRVHDVAKVEAELLKLRACSDAIAADTPVLAPA
jgi:hypothetical protein